ncbi:TonB-dependent receptor plug domain-containing protein [Maribacter sp. CXY002]|uniref:TonB-dependent receptor plug domain-containing protein n=1 Tax=Maribacter luteocoastalis TaxID=3407671 RepID=UPI003B67F567
MRYLLLICVVTVQFCLAQNQSSEKVKIEATVVNYLGIPVKKAILYIDSIKTFVRSNKQGNFTTEIPSSTQSLSVYSKTHGLITKVYGMENHIDFQFPNNIVNELTERNLQDMGFTVVAPRKGSIDPARFKEYTDIYKLIRELFTGVEVNGSNIVVRGSNSFGDTTPLFVVDDSYVPSISFINPVELKSIELLKGEETTLYGSRGANGVFIIHLAK